jgi:hypothetical protein
MIRFYFAATIAALLLSVGAYGGWQARGAFDTNPITKMVSQWKAD